LAPLHNPYNLLTIETARNLLPNIPHIAVFDTCFHQTIPDYAYIYGIPYEYYQKYKIRRYGFHGTSHQYVARKISSLLNNSKAKIVSSHLGNGASVCAISSGESKDTSMGFTPLEGLIMNTRCGDLDPAIIPFLLEQEGFYQKEIEGILNKKSGLLGISGISGNAPELIKKMEEGDKRATLAIESFCYRLKKYICAYLGILGGADAIAFTGGVGESSPFIREKVLSNLEFLGVKLDMEKNNASLEEISGQNSKVKLFVIPTNEELIIAKEAKRVLEKINSE
ncbi:MAG: acetate/propionate family kinase, partial [Armatimonadetes bacterium]|nr:acetate/propionate family kinase [Armatimonadota bacterium]